MDTLTGVAVDGDDPDVATLEDLIRLREQTWQQYQARRLPDPLASLEGTDRLIAAAALEAGYMACYGDFRELILASQTPPGGEPNVSPHR